MTAELTLRRATAADFPAIVALARDSLGWADDDERFLVWKHQENAFGASPMWVALDGDRVVGFRAFLRWEFFVDGRVVEAVRAVDTATHPEYQGRGIFTRLTLQALDELRAEGIELVFNTPNDKSRPGYLKMGWQEVGQLRIAAMPLRLRCLAVLHTARRSAGRWPLPTESGEAAATVLQPASTFGPLLASQPEVGIVTRRTPEYLAWRYGHEGLGYRVVRRGVALSEGFAVFRLRRRGKAIECVVCDVLVPEGDARLVAAMMRRVRAVVRADYIVRLDPRLVAAGPFVRIPGMGPILTCRTLDEGPVAPLEEWRLTMGDVELF